MKPTMVSYTMETLPPLTTAQHRHLAALAARRDMPDLTYIPELTDAALALMRRWSLYRPVKQQITARVDAPD
jgi:hypothetical protein